MNRPIGRREAHKQATRAALRDAAKALFAAQGYEATTVRQVAAAAQVTERTLYRYFDGKAGLLADNALTWMETLGDAIGARPACEPPLVAIQSAMVGVVRASSVRGDYPRFRQFAEGERPLELLRRSTPRPLQRLEQVIAASLKGRSRPERLGAAASPPDSQSDFQDEVLARAAVAMLRSAAIRHHQLQTQPGSGSPGIAQLLEDAFATLDGSSHASRVTRPAEDLHSAC